MPLVKIRVRAELNGRIVNGFPLEATAVVPQLQGFNFNRLVQDAYQALPAGFIGTSNLIVVRAVNAPIALRFGGQADSEIPINPGGLMLVFLAAAPASDAKLKNLDEEDSAKVLGVIGGPR